MNNTYLLMRHGKSLANEQNIVVSHPDNGTTGYGLTNTGRQQVQKACKGLPRDIVIAASDFLRTRQTAKIVAQTLNIDTPILFTSKLRERFLGEYELKAADIYPTVWDKDKDMGRDREQAFSTQSLVEPCDRVLARALSAVDELEQKFCGRNILLVSHGDVLQILLAHFNGASPFTHRSLDHLDTAEIRQLSKKRSNKPWKLLSLAPGPVFPALSAQAPRCWSDIVKKQSLWT